MEQRNGLYTRNAQGRRQTSDGDIALLGPSQREREIEREREREREIGSSGVGGSRTSETKTMLTIRFIRSEDVLSIVRYHAFHDGCIDSEAR